MSIDTLFTWAHPSGTLLITVLISVLLQRTSLGDWLKKDSYPFQSGGHIWRPGEDLHEDQPELLQNTTTLRGTEPCKLLECLWCDGLAAHPVVFLFVIISGYRLCLSSKENIFLKIRSSHSAVVLSRPKCRLYSPIHIISLHYICLSITKRFSPCKYCSPERWCQQNTKKKKNKAVKSDVDSESLFMSSI